MKLIILSILLGVLHFSSAPSSSVNAACFQNDSIAAVGDTARFSDQGIENVKENRLYKKLETFGKIRAFLYVISFIGGILALRFSAPVLRFCDNLLLRFQRRPNAFDGYRFTGNPFILKGPFYAIYHLFLGKSSYRSYLVWPLKYCIAISFIATIVIRILPDESFHTVQDFQALLISSLTVQLAFGLLFLLYLTILVLLCIESIRKTKWFFPLRLSIFLLIGIAIFTFMYKLFWFVVGIAILYLFTNLGRDYIARQRDTADEGYSEEDFIYEPWPDGSRKVYSKI